MKKQKNIFLFIDINARNLVSYRIKWHLYISLDLEEIYIILLFENIKIKQKRMMMLFKKTSTNIVRSVIIFLPFPPNKQKIRTQIVCNTIYEREINAYSTS